MLHAVDSRFRAILLGDYGVEYPLPLRHFHGGDLAHTPQTAPRAASERAVWLTWGVDVTQAVPTDRTGGFAHSVYKATVSVAYALTGSGDGPEAMGPQSGPGDSNAIALRAQGDAQRIVSALCSWRNVGGLTPHVIDCALDSISPLETLDDRAVLSVVFSVLLRVPLLVS